MVEDDVRSALESLTAEPSNDVNYDDKQVARKEIIEVVIEKVNQDAAWYDAFDDANEETVYDKPSF